MEKKDKQLEAFIAQAQEVVREWIIAEVEDKDTHPRYTKRSGYRRYEKRSKKDNNRIS